METTNLSLGDEGNCSSDGPDAAVVNSRKRKSNPKVTMKYETFDEDENGYEVFIENWCETQIGPQGSLSDEHDDDSESGSIVRRKNTKLERETSQERHIRLAKMSAYSAQRLAKETTEQRALRLKRMSEYAARRLSKESPEARAIRLQRMSEYAARRIASETPEQRATRLARMSAYAAKRHALKKAQSAKSIESSD